MNYAPLAAGPDRAVAAALDGSAAGISAPTSGSTGAPRQVLISGDAIRAGAEATDRRLGGPGSWLLAMPTDRIAGAMVLARATLAGAHVHPLSAGSFTPELFARGVDGLIAEDAHAPRRYVSLVPTQLGRLLDSPVGREALDAFDAILVGGAALQRTDVPHTVVTTYGMTETAGGCVYDGLPLDIARVELDDEGRVLLTGPMLADGYADQHGQPVRDPHEWPTRNGETWLRTRDLGELSDGRLRLLGRADDVLISGGVNVHPMRVERALVALPDIADAVVVGLPDAEWGEQVAALVTLTAGAAEPSVTDLHRALTHTSTPGAAALSRAELPRRILAVDTLPRLDSGKIDRQQARRLLQAPNGDA